MWIVLPVILITTGSLVVYITDGICMWDYQMMHLNILTTGFFAAYLLPLVMMVFFYSRIVYALKVKVGL